MIGHYLLTLSEAQEDRVLTRVMIPGDWNVSSFGGPCLLGTVHPETIRGQCVGEYGAYLGIRGAGLHSYKKDNSVAWHYDGLCRRFGTAHINGLIRNRILSNRARRVLQHIPVGVGEDRPAL